MQKAENQQRNISSRASCKTHRALKNTQKRKKSEIVANNKVNATTNAQDTDTEPMDTDNINNAETEIDKSEDMVMSDDNLAISDKDSPHTTSGNDNAENSEPGENSTEDAPSPLIYGRKMNDPTKVKTSKRHRPVRVAPLESRMGNPHVDKDTTGKAKSHASDTRG